MAKVLPEFKQTFAQYELIASTGGRFEISVDDTLLYSKLETRSFPSEDRIIEMIKEHIGQRTS